MARIGLVLFDLDGTLLDEHGLPDAMRRACARIAARASGSTTTDALVEANTAEWQQLWPEVEDDWMLQAGRGATVVQDAWRGTLRRAGVDEGLLGFALEAWADEERTAHEVYDDVPGALDALEAAGVRVGLVTNGASVVQRAKLEATHLLGRFDPLVISSEVGVRKPGAEIFEIALAAAGARHEATRYVGDNLWHDIAGAAGAGIGTIWIDRPGYDLKDEWPQPDLVLRSLADLPPAIAAAG